MGTQRKWPNPIYKGLGGFSKGWGGSSQIKKTGKAKMRTVIAKGVCLMDLKGKITAGSQSETKPNPEKPSVFSLSYLCGFLNLFYVLFFLWTGSLWLPDPLASWQLLTAHYISKQRKISFLDTNSWLYHRCIHSQGYTLTQLGMEEGGSLVVGMCQGSPPWVEGASPWGRQETQPIYERWVVTQSYHWASFELSLITHIIIYLLNNRIKLLYVSFPLALESSLPPGTPGNYYAKNELNWVWFQEFSTPWSPSESLTWFLGLYSYLDSSGVGSMSGSLLNFFATLLPYSWLL